MKVHHCYQFYGIPLMQFNGTINNSESERQLFYRSMKEALCISTSLRPATNFNNSRSNMELSFHKIMLDGKTLDHSCTKKQSCNSPTRIRNPKLPVANFIAYSATAFIHSATGNFGTIIVELIVKLNGITEWN